MKFKKLFSSVCSALTAVSILAATESAIPLSVSAVDNKLNIRVYMDECMCVNLNSICDEEVIGTYGVPVSFTTRLSNITNYAYGYYMSHNIRISFSTFNTSTDLIESPAYQCANLSSNFYQILLNGCTGVTNTQCTNGSYHCNNIERFVDCIPAYNSNATGVILLTTSNICNSANGAHFNVDGATSKNDMLSVIRDTDYIYDHNGETTNLYAYGCMVTVHELGHFFDVVDHYGTATTSDDYCIWGDLAYSYDVAKSCTTCSTCNNTIVANQNYYNHT